jgi:hypothetical protein
VDIVKPPADPAIPALDHELGLVRSAIAMVASGGSPRVSLGGLQFGEQLIETARALALQAGVRIVPIWSSDECGADLRVERIVDD